LKVLILNESDTNGGAARAASRLHSALLKNNIHSRMLVQNKISNQDTVIGPDSKIGKLINLARPALDVMPYKLYKDRTGSMFSPSSIPFSSILKKIKEINPDIVHLHWIAGGMLTIKEISKINIPIVWSLHDDWAFTGGCHIKLNCNKYKQNCGSCPVLGSDRNYDLSRVIYNRKKNSYKKMNNLTVIGLSKWLQKCAQESSLFKGKNVINLPNLIDTSIYHPINKTLAKDFFGINPNKKLILFGAMNAVNDVTKGFSYLKKALEKIDSSLYEIGVFGSFGSDEAKEFKQKINFFGHFHDDISLAMAYSAADVMVVPSIQENLSNVIMESLSCGTPVVAFNVGGNSDLIIHKKNGYLAKPFDELDLANGISFVSNGQEHNLSLNARSHVLNNYDDVRFIKKYVDLYKNIINQR
jgi:glycosyltransferase involved in cell wall biosynthesis